MNLSWRKLLLWSLPILVIFFFIWQGLLSPNNNEIGQNISSSRMTYGRFLEYLNMGWVKKVDIYDSGHTAIIEAVGPELGNRVQKIRVELPASAPELINKLKQSKIDFDAHPARNTGAFWGIIGNLFFPLLLVLGISFLFSLSNNAHGGP